MRDSSRYTASLTSDDPEVAHRKAIRNSKSIKHVITPDPMHNLSLDSLTIRRRIRFPSLTWVHRQMLRDTKDDNLEVFGSNETESPNPIACCGERRYRRYMGGDFSCQSEAPENIDTSLSDPSHIIMDRYSALDGLLAAFEDGNLEASVILAELVTAPCFAEDSFCFICHEEFSVALFRHHCRHCGKKIIRWIVPNSFAGHSFCRKHSECFRPIYKFGYTDAVRICEECQKIIDMEVTL